MEEFKMSWFSDISDWRADHEEVCDVLNAAAVASAFALGVYSLSTAKKADAKAESAVQGVNNLQANLYSNSYATGYGAAANQQFLDKFRKNK